MRTMDPMSSSRVTIRFSPMSVRCTGHRAAPRGSPARAGLEVSRSQSGGTRVRPRADLAAEHRGTGPPTRQEPRPRTQHRPSGEQVIRAVERNEALRALAVTKMRLALSMAMPRPLQTVAGRALEPDLLDTFTIVDHQAHVRGRAHLTDAGGIESVPDAAHNCACGSPRGGRALGRPHDWQIA